MRGLIKMVGVPTKLGKTPGEPRVPPPLLGQHTEEILVQQGYSLEDIAGLEKMGVIRTSPFKN
ncbi:MAG: hypothetical protein SU899_06005 [Chloroflexota bacterium]|nr:hypothetical protein [Chloroflexota bacterium]